MTEAFCQIPLPELFNFEESLWYLDRNFDDISHKVEGKSVVKAIRRDGDILLFRVLEHSSALQIDLLLGSPTEDNKNHLALYVCRWLDLRNDIRPFYSLLSKDLRLAHLASDFNGLRAVGINELFEALGWSIIGQQINLSFAYRLKRRLTELYGTTISYGNQNYYLFPEPMELVDADLSVLREHQFSQKKAEYIIGLAQKFASGELSQAKIGELANFESQQNALTAVRGIGIWTANYALMKTFRISQAVPYGDAGLYNALLKLGIISDRKEVAKIEALFAEYSGWEHYLVYYLWRTLAQKSN